MLERLQQRKGSVLLGLVALWFILAKVFQGRDTLELSIAENSPVTSVFGDAADSIRGNRTKSPIFIYFFNPIRLFINGFVEAIRTLISVPTNGAAAPYIGWFGVIALIAFICYATSRLRIALLAVALLLGCGALGMWQFTMDTIAMTIAAVLLSLAIGIPLGIWAGLSDRALKALTPILDLAQILPTLVYLAPLALFFMIGVAAATVATMVYSIPIAIRITSHAIRSLNFSPVEASISMGATEKQTLAKVQLPMAKQMIVLGINQTVMAALSFVVIAALIAAPGLGKPVIDALIIRNTGRGFVAGLAVVFLAIMLDRATSAAARKQQSFIPPTPKQLKMRRIKVAIAGVVALISTIGSSFINSLAVFPANFNVATQVENVTNSFTEFLTTDFYFATIGFKDLISIWVLNPIENVLAQAPWYLTISMIVLIALLLGGVRVAILSFALLIAIVASGIWFDAMITLTQTIVATILTMIVGVALGIWVGRSNRADSFLRPFLDAGQTLPAFVYLVPMLGLFGPTRFTAIATGIIYSIPVVVKIVGEGIRTVPASIVEAATAAGSNVRQIITKVQLPASKKALLLATNQGMIFVLAVIVIGGFVGSGGLGYLVILGSSKPELQGKGLVAGFVILLLGIMIDRIAQAAARRV
ncbi:MAG: ABC transporter permease [Candidatus Nanopelagicaceae bacterium]